MAGPPLPMRPGPPGIGFGPNSSSGSTSRPPQPYPDSHRSAIANASGNRIASPLSLPNRPQPALGQGQPASGYATPPAQRPFTPTPLSNHYLDPSTSTATSPYAPGSHLTTPTQYGYASGTSPHRTRGTTGPPPPVASTSSASHTPGLAVPDNAHPNASPWSAIPSRIKPEQVVPTTQLIEIGEGWTVRYRAWKAPAIFVSCASQQADEDGQPTRGGSSTRGRMDYDPWRAPLGAVSPFPAGATFASVTAKGKAPARQDPGSGSDSQPPAKKARKASTTVHSDAAGPSTSKPGNAFDELLAQEMGTSTSSTGSTSHALGLSTSDTGSLLGEAIRTPPLPSMTSAADSVTKPMRLPAAVRKARAEAAAAASASLNSTANQSPQPTHPLQASIASTADSSSSQTASSGSRSRLETLSDPEFLATDPLQLALRYLDRRRDELAHEGRDRLDLLWHVQRQPVAIGVADGPDVNGKGKADEKDSDDGSGPPGEGDGRVLWVFSVVKGGEKDADEEHADESTTLIDDLNFDGLTALAQGDFTHATLFPRLYSAAPDSPTQFLPPAKAIARSYPSALALSEKILTVPSAVDPTPSILPLQGAYTVFRDAVAACIIDELASHPPDGRKCLRFHRAAAFFADPSRLFADLVPPPTFRIEVTSPTFQRSSLVVSSVVTEVALTPLPTGAMSGKPTLNPLATGSQLLLAPVEISATFVKEVSERALSTARLHDLRAEWADGRRLAGLTTEGPDCDAYVVCRLQAKDGQADVDVFWPRALVLENRASTESDNSAQVSASNDLDSTASTSPAMAKSVDHDSVAHCAPSLPESSDVWAWYKQETQRREDEKAEALRREQEERESAQRKEHGDSAASDKPKHAPNAPHPAAPINERTPMSLGTASTEAPSPAELLALPPPQASASTTDLARPEDCRDDREPHQSMDIDFGLGFYPSPAEPEHQMLSGSSAPSAPPSAPMSSIDAALSSFDWGDGTFGAGSSAEAAALPHPSLPAHDHRYEDNMLLGLTDDDFSFFDTTPVAGEIPGMEGSLASEAVSTAALAVSEPHAFAPFVSTSVQHPPSNTFDFDMLGIGSDQPVPFPPPHNEPFGDPTLHVPPLHSHALEGTHSDPSVSVTEPVFGLPSPASNGPDTPSPPAIDYSPTVCSGPTRPGAPAKFAHITFDDSTTAIENRYDQRRGKYGLPSPKSEDGDARMQLVPAHGREKRRTRSWYEALCDPHVLRADRLFCKRSSSSGKAGRLQQERVGRGSVNARPWVHRKVVDPAEAIQTIDAEVAFSPDGWPVEELGDSSGTEEMDDDETLPSSDSESDERASVNVRKTSVLTSDESKPTVQAAVLAVCGEALGRVLASSPVPGADYQTTSGPRSAIYEMIYATFAEVVVYQRFLRRLLLGRSVSRTTVLGSSASSSSIGETKRILTSVCSSLGVPPLFADPTTLPSLVEEQKPMLSLRTQDCVVRAEPLAFDHWRAMGLEPLTAAKTVTAFLLVEADEQHNAPVWARDWLMSMSSTYEGLRLGQHHPARVAASTSMAGIEDGLLLVPPGRLAGHGTDFELKSIFATIFELAKTQQNIVVYIHASITGAVDQLAPLADLLQQLAKCRAASTGPSVNVLAVPVALSDLEVRRGPDPSMFASLAFSVFDQLQIAVERLRLPAPETFPTARPPPIAPLGPAVRLFQAPAMTLALPTGRQTRFALSWPPSSFDVEDRHRFLHVCYAARPVDGAPGHEWLVISVVDEKGETWRVLPRYLKYPPAVTVDVHRARIIWNFTKGIVDSADVEWRILVCKFGEPGAVEIKAWESVLGEFAAQSKRPLHLSYACIDTSPALALARAGDAQTRPSTTSSIPEEGEYTLEPSAAFTSKGPQPSVFDPDPSFFSFTPTEPISLPSTPVVAPASTFLFHVPRLTNFAHAASVSFDELKSSQTTTAYGIHLLCSTASKSSLYDDTVEAYLADVRRNFVELAGLGKARWGTSGRMAWHIEAARDSLLLSTV